MRTSVLGRWKITEMEQWELEFLDMVEPAHITFEKGGWGSFHFGCVDADFEWRLDPGSGRVDFTIQGFDEEDDVDGKGWAKAESKLMIGHIGFHPGEESGFKAKKAR
jgi:hypothetical protein